MNYYGIPFYTHKFSKKKILIHMHGEKFQKNQMFVLFDSVYNIEA